LFYISTQENFAKNKGTEIIIKITKSEKIKLN